MSSIRCALGWHDWGRWRPFATGAIVKQGRRCIRCGLCDGRAIADYSAVPGSAAERSRRINEAGRKAMSIGQPDPESPDYDPRLYCAQPGKSGDTA